jgi:orotidine-5'-phosphate decarboxylase
VIDDACYKVAREALCVALDVPINKLRILVSELKVSVGVLKITARNIMGSHPPGVYIGLLKEQGYKVFFDLKVHDIPNTVAGIVKEVAATGADFLTIHASGGPDMIKAAREAAEGTDLKLLAVTVLTSINFDTIREIAEPILEKVTLQSVKEHVPLMAIPVKHIVYGLARMALQNGAHGIVCSVHELEALRSLHDVSSIFVTPGIRLPSGDTHDQKRVATPEMAIEKGSDLLVVGRAITQAKDPAVAAEGIRFKITDALTKRKEHERKAGQE